ncbi:biotin synthase BioB [Seleniivibrio sp.]|uniref:biotin synthase BioB n=1 Tax=Seleniivibrio sp. TaxID=2898801 RepID=UPI0025EFB265|nr:biotin synthase BioB [Seleniivibrio sp.]MCD8552700.1 biotin synthase BioB [Seleniivibrio sp.]
MIEKIYEKALGGGLICLSEACALIDGDLEGVMGYARRLRDRFTGKTVKTCAIVNARSGHCSEDCVFCAQSSHYGTKAPVFPFIDIAEIEKAAKRVKELGVERFSIVSSGLSPTPEEFLKIKQAVSLVSSIGLQTDISVGCLSYEQLKELKKAGLDSYHHNLETSRSFFPEICTTHSYDDDVNAVKEALRAGIDVCSGGIFGIGENWEHRYELAVLLRELGVQSVPINFLNPVAGTPKEGTDVLLEEEAMRIIAVYRFILPDRTLRVCGGRNAVFKADSAMKIFSAGASGMMVGDYLTVKGTDIFEDMDFIHRKLD